MKITISQKPADYDYTDADDFNEFNYSLNAEMEISDDATATEAVLVMAKALEIEGYLKDSIIKALETAADYLKS